MEKSLRSILGRLFGGTSGRSPRPAEPGPGLQQAGLPGNIVATLRRVEEVLASTEVPGFDIDLITSGVVKRIRLSRDGSKAAIFIDYTGSDPGCYYCKFINWSLWKRLLADVEAKIKSVGVKEVVFIDWATGAVVEYKEKD
ncbi:hypothetical protein [Aeropyrum camini]|uniref:Uncharacterized protein n=1 Tax=Aeropyrum camini SY1 = JCM 12091 TaxID=1198449 RepID=U3TDH4_9CREN|nr:hypothetical protein [Aeropyrum camini]BAN90481.1 hypothetical protein ACAM_1012 [Aeropyrum camini SY1 = JCM 12091]